MANAICRFAGERDRIDSADGKVPGIKAPLDFAVIKYPLNIARSLNQGLNMGMQNLLEPMLAANIVNDGKHLHHVCSLIGVKCARHGPSLIHDNRRDELTSTGPFEQRGRGFGRRDSRCPTAAIMEDEGVKPPISVMSNSASSALIASGVAAKNPGAPSSVAGRSKLDISPRTRSVGSITPQPGTSQIPQEIGAEATLDIRLDMNFP